MKWGSERVLAVARSSVRAAWRLGGLVRVAFGPSEDERLGTLAGAAGVTCVRAL